MTKSKLFHIIFLGILLSSFTSINIYPQEIEHDPNGGACTYYRKGDNKQSKYYVNRDFYNCVSNDTLSILSHFETMQQSTEWSCGNMAILMALKYLGIETKETEWSLAEAMHSMTDRRVKESKPGTAHCICDYGTRLSDMYHFLKGMNTIKITATSFRESYTTEDLTKEENLFPICDFGNLYPTFSDPSVFSTWLKEHLNAKRPIIVQWSDWDGHFVCIIGIDNNGTPNFTGDDILIFADSYDTSDHCQDGYTIAPLERFFYSWKDRKYAPKPYQLQPFIVIEKNNSLSALTL